MRERYGSCVVLLMAACAGTAQSTHVQGPVSLASLEDACAQPQAVAPPSVLYRSAAGGSSVVLPREPSAAYGDVETADELVLVDQDAVYIVKGESIGIPIPESARERNYDRVRDGAASQVNGTVTRDQPVRCGAYIGRDFVVLSQSRDGASRVRVFFVGALSYRISFTAAAGIEQSAKATAFLSSLRIEP